MKKSLLGLAAFLTVLAIHCFSTIASSQTLSLNDQNILQNQPNRTGLNIGSINNSGTGQVLKNLIGSTNPGFEPLQAQQIWTLKAGGTTTSFTLPDTSDSMPARYWEGGTFTVVESQARGAELGCTGTIAANTGRDDLLTNETAPAAPVITTSNACHAPFQAGDVIILSKSTFPTPESWWENRQGGMAGSVRGGARLLSDTTDLCTNCGVQALNMSAPIRGSAASATWSFDDSRDDIYVLMNGTYQLSFWAKSASGTPALSISASRLSKGGFNCGTYTPKLTSSWTQHTFTCTASESAATTPGKAEVSFAVTGGSIYLDNVSFEKSSSDSSNTTVLRDEVIQVLQNYYGSATGGNPGMFRYWVGQNGETLSNWIEPDYAHAPTAAGAGYFVGPNGAGSMQLTLEDYLVICQLLNAEPYLEIPASFSTSDATNLIRFLAGSSSTTYGGWRAALGQEDPWTNVFPKIHLSFCDECWNGTALPGQSLPYRAGVPNGEYYYDYSVRARDVFAAMRTSSAYSASSFDLVMSAQTSVNESMDAAIRRARPDSIEIGSNLYGTVNSFGSDAALWRPAVVEPYEIVTNPADPNNFYQSLHDYQSQKTCGASGTAPCNVHIYDGGQNTVRGSIDQTHLDYIHAGAGQGVVSALQPLLNLQYYGIEAQFLSALSEPSNNTLENPVARLRSGLVDLGGATNNERPTFLGLSLVNQSIIGAMYSCSIDQNLTYRFPGSVNGNSPLPALNKVPYLYAFCFENGNKRSLVLINTDTSNAHTISFAGTHPPQGTVTMRQFAPNDLNDMNEAPTGASINQTAASVAVEMSTLSSPNSIALPSFSVTALDYTAASEPITATPTLSPSATAAYNITAALPALGVTPATTAASTITPVLPAPASSLAAGTYSTVQSATSAQVINCSSGFASSGTCGVAVTGSGGQPFQLTDDQSAGVVVGSRVNLIPTGSGHFGAGLIYQTAVNVQAFSTTFTFVPNGWNFAFVLQNNTNVNGGGGGNPKAFAGGAGCEAGFYQGFGTAPTSANNIFALELDQQSPLTNDNSPASAPFTYSSTQIYQQNQSPCNPNDGQPNYTFTPKISTSPVPLNSPASSVGTTTGDTYSVTLGYNGTTLNMSMYDVTAGGSCPGSSCFTQSWTVNIPSWVGRNTAYVGFTGGTNANSTHPLYVSSLVYTVLSSASTASTPTFSPFAGTYTTSQSVTISDSTPGATIYYTTNGTTPTTSSSVYSEPITVSSTETLQAIAVASGYSNSSVASATYTINATPATPTFSVAAGTYTSTQTVSISDTTFGATVYYTTNGTTPTASSTKYSGPITVSSTETLEAVAAVDDPTMSAVASATYVIESPYISYPSGGFNASSFDLNGRAAITSGGLLQLTDGGGDEGRSAWFATKVPVQTFTTDFTFQLTDAQADGFAFVIQNAGPTALGADGGGLGYRGIPQSLAIKFDLFDDAGEGPDSTGLFTQGAAPTVPAVNLTGTPINLHSGAPFAAHITYDGTDLTLTLTDSNTLGTWSYSWPINIPATVGGTTAYVGFTAGTGGETSTQNITSWTYSPAPSTPNYPAGLDGAGLQLNGATTYSGTSLQLTNGGLNEAGSAFYATPVNIAAFTTDFNFQLVAAQADGFAFVIQNAGPTALGAHGSGLGFQSIAQSVAIKFDLYNNAGEGPDSTGLFTDGAEPTVPAVNLTGTPINLHSGDPFAAHITYDGTNLTLTLTDSSTLGTWSYSWPINIPATVGGTTAYVGFTGGTGGTTSTQNINSWTYLATLSTPNYPAGFDGAGLQLNGAAYSGTSLQLTNGSLHKAGSAFYATPVNIAAFTTYFSFQLVDAQADGFTFVIQNAGPTALGADGGGLGYLGIPQSVAIKFDLFDNAGEGPDSTGLYIDGAVPTVPAINLTGTPITLHSGDQFAAHISYNGTDLALSLTDSNTLGRWSYSWPINIPATVGATTAYVGFTGGTGGETATQNVLSWTFSTT